MSGNIMDDMAALFKWSKRMKQEIVHEAWVGVGKVAELQMKLIGPRVEIAPTIVLKVSKDAGPPLIDVLQSEPSQFNPETWQIGEGVGMFSYYRPDTNAIIFVQCKTEEGK